MKIDKIFSQLSIHDSSLVSNDSSQRDCNEIAPRCLHAWNTYYAFRRNCHPDCLDYGVLIGKPCQYGMYPVHPSEEKWLMTSEGHLLIDGYPIYRHDEYCMDIFDNNSTTPFDHDLHLFMCFDGPMNPQHPLTKYSVNSLYFPFSVSLSCLKRSRLISNLDSR